MPTLPTDLRNKLERTCITARNLSERAAKAALDALAVSHHEPYGHMTAEQRNLRNKLRARARQLGDTQDAKGQLVISHLAHECAYEHWHRMLFARFLAENNLLMLIEDGEKPVAVSLEDCKELAKEAKTDLWTLAGRYAQKMLPKIFRPDDPLLQVTLARENQIELEHELNKLSSPVFLASDSLGWCYQFWQAEQKDAVNASGKKIGADELPAVTQLFTEDYMVDFLLHNTLGAWWARKKKSVGGGQKSEPKTEEEARKEAALPARDGAQGLEWNYLRFIKSDCGDGACAFRPAAGTFDGWPKTVKEIRLLDPCMGSGHFLVFALLILVRLRMEEENLSAAEACVAVLRDNLFGLELDARCTQIAAFNLALAAWKLGGYQTLPSLNLACSGLAPNVKREDWLKLAERAAQNSALAPERDLLGTREETLLSQKLKAGMERLYQLFQKAPVLGSLINPRALGGDLLVAEFHELQPLLEQVLQREKADDTLELAVTAQGVAKAAEILAGHFTLVATNVPYLGRGKQDDVLKDYCERVHPDAKADLANCFVERCLDFCESGTSTVLVTPQNWLFLSSYSALRKRLLKESCWNFLAKLGPNAFQDMNWWAAITMLMVLTRSTPPKDHLIHGCDVGSVKDQGEKASLLAEGPLKSVSQVSQLSSPKHAITFEDLSGRALLCHLARSVEGLSTGDGDRFLRKAWEFPQLHSGWEFFHVTPDETVDFGGLSEVVFWEDGNGELNGSEAARIQGHYAWGKKGVLVSKMNRLKCCLYFGAKHDKMSAAIVAENADIVPALWAFCSSEDYHEAVRSISQKVDVATNTLAQVPFDAARWKKVAAAKYPDGLPKPVSSDPTQWLFDGHPKGSDQPLHVAVARLLGYRWPRQTGSSFPDCPALGADGLEAFADDDGIVCIPSVRGEEPAAERLRKLLAAAYGENWKPHSERELIRATGSSASDFDEWLRNDFFQQHCDIFYQRPFIWHVWDSRKRDGFHALVNYHKLAGVADHDSARLKEDFVHPGQKVLASLTHSHLGEWIVRQKDGVKRGEEGAEERLAAAEALKERLEAIFVGESPFDLFVRWKPLRHQAVGWTPDINDGVRMNIRPFATADILRKRVKIKWEKDRGNEPMRDKADFPWFWKDGAFTGERLNDVHLKKEQKENARKA